jgi:type IV secretory pathway TraG/TraD family ATPase VirD4
MDLMLQVMSQLPAYGIKAVPIVQNLGQIKRLYGDAHTTFTGNTAAQIFFSLNDQDTAKHASEWLGQQEFIEESSNYSENVQAPEWRGWKILGGEKARDHEKRGGRGESASVSHSRKVEAIMRPEEIRQHTSRSKGRMLVVTADGAPLFLKRVRHFERFSTEFYESQETIMWAEAAQ